MTLSAGNMGYLHYSCVSINVSVGGSNLMIIFRICVIGNLVTLAKLPAIFQPQQPNAGVMMHARTRETSMTLSRTQHKPFQVILPQIIALHISAFLYQQDHNHGVQQSATTTTRTTSTLLSIHRPPAVHVYHRLQA